MYNFWDDLCLCHLEINLRGHKLHLYATGKGFIVLLLIFNIDLANKDTSLVCYHTHLVALNRFANFPFKGCCQDLACISLEC